MQYPMAALSVLQPSGRPKMLRPARTAVLRDVTCWILYQLNVWFGPFVTLHEGCQGDFAKVANCAYRSFMRSSAASKALASVWEVSPLTDQPCAFRTSFKGDPPHRPCRPGADLECWCVSRVWRGGSAARPGPSPSRSGGAGARSPGGRAALHP